MKIAQIIDGLRMAGGAERLQLTLALALESHPVDFTIITMGSDQPEAVREFEARGIRVVRFAARRFADPRRAIRLYRFLRAERFDIVHTHLVRSTVLGTFLAKCLGVATVSTIHHSKANDRLASGLVRLEKFAQRHFVDRLIAVGWETANVHRETIAGVEIEVVPNAVTRPAATPLEARRKIRDELGVAPSELLLVSVGRLAHPKNFELLIDAFATVHEIAPHAQLRIVGEGRVRPELEARIAERNLTDSVQLTGLRSDVPTILAASDIYVSSSRHEGLPLSILEAMYASLPVVATRVGDIAHVVSDDSGLLVDAGDAGALASAMAHLVDDESLRESLGAAGLARVHTHFGAGAWAERLLAIYRQATEDRRR